MAKPKLKKLAREKRKNGESIKQIATTLSVSQSSVSVWCRDIDLTNDQIKLLEKRYKDPSYGKRFIYSQMRKKEKDIKIQKLRKKGINQINKFSDNELFLVGIALYWAEGFKKDSQVGFANSDPEMIQFFIIWLVKCFGYESQDLILRVSVNESHKYRQQEIEKYWSNVTNIPLSQFQKTYIQKVKWKKEYEKTEEYFGILRIKVRKSIDFLREIHGFIEGFKLQVQNVANIR